MSFTFSVQWGRWVLFHIVMVLFAKQDRDESDTKIDLTDIGGNNIVDEDADEELARRPFGFGRRN